MIVLCVAISYLKTIHRTLCYVPALLRTGRRRKSDLWLNRYQSDGWTSYIISETWAPISTTTRHKYKVRMSNLQQQQATEQNGTIHHRYYPNIALSELCFAIDPPQTVNIPRMTVASVYCPSIRFARCKEVFLPAVRRWTKYLSAFDPSNLS